MSRLAACLANGQMRGQREKPGFEEHTLAGNEKSAKTTGWQRGVRDQLCSACCCHSVGGWTPLGALASPEGLQVSPCKIPPQVGCGLYLSQVQKFGQLPEAQANSEICTQVTLLSLFSQPQNPVKLSSCKATISYFSTSSITLSPWDSFREKRGLGSGAVSRSPTGVSGNWDSTPGGWRVGRLGAAGGSQ